MSGLFIMCCPVTGTSELSMSLARSLQASHCQNSASYLPDSHTGSDGIHSEASGESATFTLILHDVDEAVWSGTYSSFGLTPIVICLTVRGFILTQVVHIMKQEALGPNRV